MTATVPESGVLTWLEETSRTELLRLTTAGSVDDGKSTLIGRLLYDSKGVYEDQLASVRKATTNQSTKGLDLSLLTDGLRAEREQGITIDVAYRYFATPRRKFIIADTPGHEQYTRNMATGASTADLAVILIDARNGVLPQSRRHAYISALLGIPKLVVTVNKMDLVGFDRGVFERIQEEFSSFLERLEVHAATYIPISALDGDNVVNRSTRTPWFVGSPLLEFLETVPLARHNAAAEFRFPVQYVIRPDLDFRGYAGQVASGAIRPGDEVAVLPSRRQSRVKSIVTRDGDLTEAFSPQSVTLTLEDELDISRGDMLVRRSQLPQVSDIFEASLVWMTEEALRPHQPYLLKHTTRTVQARVREIRHAVDVNTLVHRQTGELRLNDIGVVAVETQLPLYFDPYKKNRATGGFILIDPISNRTVAAGMIRSALGCRHVEGPLTAGERQARFGHPALTVVLENAADDIAWRLERLLFDHGCMVYLAPSGAVDAIRTASAAGLITIVAGELAADAEEQLQQSNRVARVDGSRLPESSPAAAEHIYQSLIPLLGAWGSPLTQGDGI
jgi:sulfate adenylyltransferase large subunit